MPKPTITVPDTDPPASLEIVDDVVGDGAEASPGNTVSVHYVGVAWSTGSQFDASWDRMEPFSFGLGAGQVIQGWDQGVAGMRVGGRRTLTIPPAPRLREPRRGRRDRPQRDVDLHGRLARRSVTSTCSTFGDVDSDSTSADVRRVASAGSQQQLDRACGREQQHDAEEQLLREVREQSPSAVRRRSPPSAPA